LALHALLEYRPASPPLNPFMRFKPQNWLLVALVSLITLITIMVVVFRDPKTAVFSRLVLSPVPHSVSGIDLKANDILNLSLTGTGFLESTYFMRFCTTPEDMDNIVQHGKFDPVANAASAPGGPIPAGAPFWWKEKFSLDGVELYTRSGRISGTDYLWIDKTKTRGFYMWWNI
jgi:hypothetical protein